MVTHNTFMEIKKEYELKINGLEQRLKLSEQKYKQILKTFGFDPDYIVKFYWDSESSSDLPTINFMDMVGRKYKFKIEQI